MKTGEHEEILKKTIQLAKSEGINEIIAQMNDGKTYQVHFSNSTIDNVKIWDEEVLELFLVKDKRTTQINVEAPDLDKIKNAVEGGVREIKGVRIFQVWTFEIEKKDLIPIEYLKVSTAIREEKIENL